MQLYIARQTPTAMRVYAVAFELGIVFDDIPVALVDGQMPANIRALCPNGGLPLLVDGDVALWDSRAIAFYLASLYPEFGLLPTDLLGQARVHQWSYYQALDLGPPMQSLIQHRFFAPMRGASPDPVAIAAAEAKLARYMSTLETALHDRDWLLDDFSLADLLVGALFPMRQPAGITLDDWPAVRAWAERLGSRPAWQKAVALTNTPA